MRRARRVLLNTAASVLQVVVNGVLYLVLYRFLYDTIGIDQLGVWSVVVAWTSVNNLANLGLGGSTRYFIPKHLARDDRPYVRELIQTGILTAALFVAAGVLVFLPFVQMVLGFVIEPESLLPLAVSIIPYAFGSLWLSSTAAVVYSSIDGFQRVDLRNLILIVGAVVFLGTALVLVPEHGIVGLAQAQVLQQGTVLVVSWIVLHRLMPELPLLPWRWSRRAFHEMIGYSLQFQVVASGQMLVEPLTKSLLSVFAGAGAAGFFEMANRLALQLRALIVTAHSSLLPTLTDIGERTPQLLHDIYETSSRLVAFLLLILLPFLIAVSPFISLLWLGEYEPTFVLFAILLFIGWFGNMIGNPAYFGYMGTGDLRWNVRSHLLVALINGVLGAAFGMLYGGAGIVVGFTLAQLAGSLMIAAAYQHEHDLGLESWLHRDNALLGLAALIGMGSGLFLFFQWSDTLVVPTLGALTLAVYALFVAAPAWRHTMRRPLVEWAKHLLPARGTPRT